MLHSEKEMAQFTLIGLYVSYKIIIDRRKFSHIVSLKPS